MRFQIGFLVISLSLAVNATAQPSREKPAPREIRVTDGAVLQLPANFKTLPATTGGLTEIVAGISKKQSAYIQVTTEKRRSEDEAIRRLLEVAQESGGKRAFVEICGWPALERQYRVKLDQVMADIKGKIPEPPTVEAATIAIAQGDTLIRFEARLQAGASAAGTGAIFGVVRTIHCAANPNADSAKMRIGKLKQMLSENPYGAEFPDPLAPSIRPPQGEAVFEKRNVFGSLATVEASLGAPTSEIQIAASKDGKTVVVGSNQGTSFSNDFGGTFSASTTPAFVEGDPTLAIGASGMFYRGGINITSAGCMDPVAVNTRRDGVNFTLTTKPAAFCAMTSNNLCFPDQPQMAADSRNSAASGDQLYVVWRNFTRDWFDSLLLGTAHICTDLLVGQATPTISCSANNGSSWGHQQFVGSGDVGRITVGPDGFVYVTYIAGDNQLMLNKFSSCATGLNQVPGFPVTVAPFVGLDCPISGVDRCGASATSSPQPAVAGDFPNHVFVAYAEKSSSTNDNILVRHSSDGGHTWPDRFIANSATAPARRFMPWVCANGTSAKVSWYDRRAVTAMDNTLTDYFFNTVSVSGPGTETKLTSKPDSQRSGVNAVCTGCTIWGDYNGNTCTQDRTYVGWSSSTPPPGVAAPGGVNVFVQAIPLGPPSVTSVSPASEQCGSAAPIAIAGANFTGATIVQLQTTGLTASLPSFTINSSSLITATLPSTLPGGVYEVVVFTPTGTSTQSLSLPRTDLFSVAPTVTGLAPNNGLVAGATAVTVNGSCFEHGSRFFFGTNEASVSQCPSTTQCTVYSPAATESAAFPVDVVADAGGAKSATNTADLFTYTGPQITTVSPSSGPVTGGTPVFISGSGFPQVNEGVFSLSPPVMILTFGGIRAIADCYPTWCTLSTPMAYTAGPVDVEMDAFGTIDVLPQGFTYTAAPKLVRFDASATYSGAIEVAGLDGYAAVGGASVTVTSSDPSLVIPTSLINIPAGGLVVSAPVTVNPSSTYQTVTLTATYNGTTLTGMVAVPPSPGLTISMDGTALDQGQSANVTVSINSPAPAPGGAVVNLSSSSPSAISVPTSVTIPAGQYSTTFSVTNQYSGGSSLVTISGSYNGASASDTIIVFTPPPACQVQQCAHLYYWDSTQCKCVKGVPKVQ